MQNYLYLFACLLLMSCTSVAENKAVVDDLDDFQKINSHTPGLVIEKDVESNIYDFDSVLKLDDSTSVGTATYYAPFGIKTLLVHTYKNRRSVDEELNFYVSADGNDYVSLDIDSRLAPKQAYPHWQHIIYEKNNPEATYRYLRVELKRGSFYSPCIGSVNINAEDDLEYVNEFRGYTAERIVKAICEKHPNNGHPRIKATKEDFENMRRWYGKDEYFSKSAERIIKRANEMLEEDVIEYKIDYQGYLLATARTVLGRMETLGQAFQLTGDRKYVDRAWKDLEAAANFKDWKPDHYLDTAELTCAFAYAYDWMYDAWTAEQKAVIRNAIVEHGLKTAWDVYSGRTVWYSWENNMNTVSNSGIALGAMAIADEVPELSGKIILEALKSIQNSITRYAPDGAYREGPNYWGYGTKYLVNFLSTLESSIGTDFDLSQTPGLEKTGYFPTYVMGPNGTFNYADGGLMKLGAIEQLWFARKYNQRDLAWHFRNSGRLPGLLYYSPELFSNPEDARDFPLDRYFKGVELVTFRSEWFDDNATFVGFKAGTPQEAHADMDMGTFVMDALGERWAVDLGPEDYNAPGIWEWQGKAFGARYNYYRKNPEGHNCLLVAPDSELHQKGLAFSPIVRTSLNGRDSTFAIADLTPAYERTAQKVKRGVMLLNNRKDILVQDEVTTKTASPVWWFMHTKADINIQSDASEAVLTQNGKHLYMKVLSPAGAKFQAMEAAPMPGSLKGERESVNEGFRKVAICVDNVTNTTISVLMVPLEQNNEKEHPSYQVKSMEQW